MQAGACIAHLLSAATLRDLGGFSLCSGKALEAAAGVCHCLLECKNSLHTGKRRSRLATLAQAEARRQTAPHQSVDSLVAGYLAQRGHEPPRPPPHPSHR